MGTRLFGKGAVMARGTEEYPDRTPDPEEHRSGDGGLDWEMDALWPGAEDEVVEARSCFEQAMLSLDAGKGMVGRALLNQVRRGEASV